MAFSPHKPLSAPRFTRRVRASSGLGTAKELGLGLGSAFQTGLTQGPVPAIIDGLGQAGKRLADLGFAERRARIHEEAEKQGLSDGDRMALENRALELHQADTERAEVENRARITAYFARLDRNIENKEGELYRDHGADPEGFAKRHDAMRETYKQLLPAEYHRELDLQFDDRKMRLLGRVSENHRKLDLANTNASLIESGDSMSAQAFNAWRAGDEAGAEDAARKALATLEARTDIGPEQKARARLAFQEEARRQTVIGGFERSLAGGLGEADKFIASIRDGEFIVDPSERDGLVDMMQSERDRLARQESRLQETQNRVALVAEARGGRVLLDPGSKDHKKAVDEAFLGEAQSWQGMAAPEVAGRTARFVAETGMVPETVQGMIRSGLRADNPEQVGHAVDLVARISETAPQALRDISKHNRAQAMSILGCVQAGVPMDQAILRAREATDPNNQTLRDARAKTIRDEKFADSYQSWLDDHFNQFTPLDALPVGPSDDVDVTPESTAGLEMVGDFDRLFQDWYLRTGDEEAAKTQALADLSQVWGASAVTGDLTVMKYPPEAFYGIASTGRAGSATDADADWMRAQLLEDVQAATGDANVAIDDLHLVADTKTARAGNKPTWLVMLKTESGPAMIETPRGPMRWRPDPETVQSERAQEALKQARRVRNWAAIEDQSLTPRFAAP